MAADIFSSIIIAFAFFTIIPMPGLDWTGRRMSYVPLMMPLVGLVNGSLAFGLYMLLYSLDTTPFFKAVVMCLYFIAYTGGLHTDGLMDTADAYFSRREKEKKLEIMKDSHVGAFGAITLVFVLLLKIAIFYELFSNGRSAGALILFVPVISRLFQSLMLFHFPSAKPDGLTKIFGELKVKNTVFIYIILIAVCIGLFTLSGIRALIIPLAAFTYFVIFYFSSKRQFGGITGDLLGAFLEVSELLMLFTILFI